ncbi:MAG: DUF512 domain-containing protein [Coriobacteriia bacterium]|nr:DUF512 domain-containing protein [Coriobacteriia bacterium]
MKQSAYYERPETNTSGVPDTTGDKHPRGTCHDQGNTVTQVTANSPAERGGLQTGNRLFEAEGQALHDLIDWRWYSDGERVEVTVEDPAGARRSLMLERAPGEDWGFETADVLFDGVKTCANNCEFCFMKQLPPGLRPSLYVRDDDYRLSFLQGNFVTLTNLDDAEVERIIEQRLSPLHVSLHAVDPAVRKRLIGPRQARGLEVLDQLLSAGIDVHIQIVLVPGVNDGEVLDQTLSYLCDPTRKPHIASVGIVPVAWTKYAKTPEGEGEGADADKNDSASPLRDWTDQIDAARVIEQVQRYQFAEEEAQGWDWVSLADEFYITAQAPFPMAKYYGGFPQLENGIGMVWGLIEDFKEHLPQLQQALSLVPEQSEALTLVCGELIRDTLLGALSAIGAGGKVRLLPVRNEFLGGTVSVTALLSSADILRAVTYDSERLSLPTTYLISDVIFNYAGQTLDGRTAADISATAPASLVFFPSSAPGLARAIEDLAGEGSWS